MPTAEADLRSKLWEWVARGGDLPSFDELIARPEWHRRAACRGVGIDDFFPGPGETAERAKDRCAVCPVIDECRRAGEHHAGGYGVWGGESASHRLRAARVGRGSAA